MSQLLCDVCNAPTTREEGSVVSPEHFRGLLAKGWGVHESNIRMVMESSASRGLAPASGAHAFAGRRIMLEDLDEIFLKGEVGLTRSEALAALRPKGFGKTDVYKALSSGGNFAECFYEAPNGVIAREEG